MRECGIMLKWARRASIAILAVSASAAPALGQQAAHSLAETVTQAAEADATHRSAEAQAGKLIEAKRKAAAARRAPASPRPPQPDAEQRHAAAEPASLPTATRSLLQQAQQDSAKAADRLARGRLEAAPTLAPAVAKLAAVEPGRPEGKPTTTLQSAISIEAPVSGASPSAPPASPPAAPELERMAQKHVEDAGRLAERLKRVRQRRKRPRLERHRRRGLRSPRPTVPARNACRIPASPSSFTWHPETMASAGAAARPIPSCACRTAAMSVMARTGRPDFCRDGAPWALPTPGVSAPGPAASSLPACFVMSILAACPATLCRLICTS